MIPARILRSFARISRALRADLPRISIRLHCAGAHLKV